MKKNKRKNEKKQKKKKQIDFFLFNYYSLALTTSRKCNKGSKNN